MIRAIAIIFIMLSSVRGQLTLSEIMVNPTGLETVNEYLEVYNNSLLPGSLENWVISDGSGTDTLIHWSGPDSIAGYQFALIFDPDYDLDNGIYSEQLSNNIPVYTSGTDGSLGSGGLSNSGESLFLISPTGDTVSQFSWSTSQPNGYSLEKIILSNGDGPENWGTGIILNGTPGSTNSISPPPINCVLDSVSIGPLPVLAGSRAPVYFHVHNAGLAVIDSIRVIIRHSTAPEWSVDSIWAVNLAWHDTLTLTLGSPGLYKGVNSFTGTVLVAGDTLYSDNQTGFEIILPIRPGDLAINEILYQPGIDQTEFVELINNSPDTLNLQRFQIRDNTSTTGQFPNRVLWLAPDSYLILAPDSTLLPALPTGDAEFISPGNWPSLKDRKSVV